MKKAMTPATMLPSLVCPRCGGALEQHVTIEMLDPPIGMIDTGYCRTCANLFERIRQTGTYYDSTLWPPVCRVCRQPVAFASVAAGDVDAASYQCRAHPDERWTWSLTTERWTRTDDGQ